MNYQYNQQPSQQTPPPQRPYIDPYAAKLKKKESFETLADKMNGYFQNSFFRSLIKSSDMIAYICVLVGAVIALICQIMTHVFSPAPLIFFLPAVVASVLAFSKRKVLPFALTFSLMALFNIAAIVFNIIALSTFTSVIFYYSSYELGNIVVGFVFTLLFNLVDLVIFGAVAFEGWKLYMALQPPRPVYTQYPQQTPPVQPQQQYGQQVPPQQQYQQAPSQPPVQQYQPPVQPPVQPVQPEPVQPPVQNTAPAAEKTCPNCHMINSADASFCAGCGAKL